MIDQFFEQYPFLALGLIDGLSLLIAGIVMVLYPPKKINSFYGYRTKRSMANQNNWDFAQQYSARLLIQVGFIIIVLGILGDRLLPKLDFSQKVFASMIFLFLGILYLILATEHQLKTKNRKEDEHKIRDKIR